MTDNKEYVGNNIKKYRKAAHLTQTELALKSGYVSKSSIAKIETGKSGIDMKKIPILASALNVSIEDLLKVPSDTEREFEVKHFIPYLLKASQEQLDAICDILRMPH